LSSLDFVALAEFLGHVRKSRPMKPGIAPLPSSSRLWKLPTCRKVGVPAREAAGTGLDLSVASHAGEARAPGASLEGGDSTVNRGGGDAEAAPA
jgi:hypothetical protein